MATTSASVLTPTSILWTISGLESDWNTSNYMSVGVATSAAIFDSLTPPSGILSSVSAPPTGTARSVSNTVSTLTQGTNYTIYGYAQSVNGRYYPAGSYTFTTPVYGVPSGIGHSVNGLNVTITFTKGQYAAETELVVSKTGYSHNDTTTGTSFSFTVPDYSSTYYYQLRSKSGTNYSNWSPLAEFNTLAPPIPSVSGQVVIQSRIEGGFNVTWSAGANATSYDLGWKNGFDSTWTEINTTSTSYQITGRPYGVLHDFRVRSRNSSGVSNYQSSQGTSAPRTPTISGGSTNTSILVNVSMSGNWDDVTVERLNATTNALIDTRVVTNPATTATWNGLTSGQTFKFRARSRFGVLNSVNYSAVISITVAGSTRPNNFTWTIPKAQGGNINVTVAEWTAFTNRINEFREYKSLGTIAFLPVSNSTNISATIYNQARTAIVNMSPTISPPSAVLGVSQVSNPADATDIAASHFNNIVASLNSIA